MEVDGTISLLVNSCFISKNVIRSVVSDQNGVLSIHDYNVTSKKAEVHIGFEGTRWEWRQSTSVGIWITGWNLFFDENNRDLLHRLKHWKGLNKIWRHPLQSLFLVHLFWFDLMKLRMLRPMMRRDLPHKLKHWRGLKKMQLLQSFRWRLKKEI